MTLRTKPEVTQCEEDEREIQELLAGLPQFARQSTDLPEPFWSRQQIGIQVEISVQPKPLRWPALAFGMALLVLIGALLTSDLNHAAPHEQQPALERVEAISDQQLLMKVQYTLQNDVPVALEPAALLAQEMARGNSHYSEGE